MKFSGWPAEAVEFYEGLVADNSKSYWTANKATYDNAVHAPMAALLAELEAEFGPGKIFRPYRDLRFSADKTPYKTAIGATVADSGYIQFSAQGLGVGSGMWHMATDQLRRYREAVAGDPSGEALVQIIAEAGTNKIKVHGHDSLKTAPRGFASDHPRADLLKHKGLTAWQEWPAAAWLGTPAAKDRVVGFMRATRPLRDWLDQHVGGSELPSDR
jgi:uncharacterized protein (TIGR02453 family)